MELRDNTECDHYQPVEGGKALCEKDRTAVHCNDCLSNPKNRSKHQQSMLMGRTMVCLSESVSKLEEAERLMEYINPDNLQLVESPLGTPIQLSDEFRVLKHRLDMLFGGYATAKGKLNGDVMQENVAATEHYMGHGTWTK